VSESDQEYDQDHQLARQTRAFGWLADGIRAIKDLEASVAEGSEGARPQVRTASGLLIPRSDADALRLEGVQMRMDAEEAALRGAYPTAT
jgi:hypothetical protein